MSKSNSSSDWNSRTNLLLGEDKLRLLSDSHVLIVGLGGVGAYAAEVIARAGIGAMTIVDADLVNESNINRQLPALHSTIGLYKADVLAERLRDINPNIRLVVLKEFIHEERIVEILDGDEYDFVVDAIDSLTPKCLLLQHAYLRNLNVVSSMGAGGKSDPMGIKVDDLSKTEYCQLAKNVRKRLKNRGIYKGIPVVYTTELVNKNAIIHSCAERNKESTVGTISYMPALFGCHLGAYVINKLIKASDL